MSISKCFIEQGIIKEDVQEIVDFGITQLKLQVINLLSMLLVGIIFKKSITSIFFLLFFILLRSFAGGFHARTVKMCYLISLVLVFCGFWSLSANLWTSAMCIISTLISGFLLLLIVPVDSENRRLDLVEKKKYRKVALAILSFEIALEVFGILFGFKELYEAIALGIFLTTFLGILGVWQNKK